MATTRIPIPAGRPTPLISTTWQARWGLRNLHNIGNQTISIAAVSDQGVYTDLLYPGQSLDWYRPPKAVNGTEFIPTRIEARISGAGDGLLEIETPLS
jgi:hypothetical protein